MLKNKKQIKISARPAGGGNVGTLYTKIHLPIPWKWPLLQTALQSLKNAFRGVLFFCKAAGG